MRGTPTYITLLIDNLLDGKMIENSGLQVTSHLRTGRQLEEVLTQQRGCSGNQNDINQTRDKSTVFVWLL